MIYGTPYGDAWLSFEGSSLIGLGLPGSRPPVGVSEHLPGELVPLREALEAYWVEGGGLPSPTEDVLDRASTTPLMRRIYEVVSSIESGSTLTYTDVARRAGRPGAARSVGAAMARNPFAPLIPCHRVIGSDGTLRGYGGGMELKQAMLDMEAAYA